MFDCLIGLFVWFGLVWLVGWLVWLFGWFGLLVDWLVGWLVDLVG